MVSGPLQVTRQVSLPATELVWRFSRSSGPGGQSVNTTDSRVELRFDVANSVALTAAQRDRVMRRLSGRLVDGVLTIAASEHRSQLRNREAAAARLTEELRRALEPPRPPRRATRPGRGAVERRLTDKKARSRLKAGRRETGD